jgi:hypothetical protein
VWTSCCWCYFDVGFTFHIIPSYCSPWSCCFYIRTFTSHLPLSPEAHLRHRHLRPHWNQNLTRPEDTWPGAVDESKNSGTTQKSDIEHDEYSWTPVKNGLFTWQYIVYKVEESSTPRRLFCFTIFTLILTGPVQAGFGRVGNPFIYCTNVFCKLSLQPNSKTWRYRRHQMIYYLVVNLRRKQPTIGLFSLSDKVYISVYLQ